MGKDEILQIRYNMRENVKMLLQEAEGFCKSKKSFSMDEMMDISDMLKDMSEVEKKLAKADYYDRKTS